MQEKNCGKLGEMKYIKNKNYSFQLWDVTKHYEWLLTPEPVQFISTIARHREVFSF